MDSQQITYYPHPIDDMWNREVETLIPYLEGNGVDIGSSNRSPLKGQIRVDIDKEREPDVCCSAYDMPFKDGEFDHVTMVHVFEHFEDQPKLIAEVMRILKKGGIIGIVHPDVDFTGVQKPEQANPDKNPYNKHYRECNLDGFLSWFNQQRFPGLKIIDSGPACHEWSFYVIIKKL